MKKLKNSVLHELQSKDRKTQMRILGYFNQRIEELEKHPRFEKDIELQFEHHHFVERVKEIAGLLHDKAYRKFETLQHRSDCSVVRELSEDMKHYSSILQAA